MRLCSLIPAKPSFEEMRLSNRKSKKREEQQKRGRGKIRSGIQTPFEPLGLKPTNLRRQAQCASCIHVQPAISLKAFSWWCSLLLPSRRILPFRLGHIAHSIPPVVIILKRVFGSRRFRCSTGLLSPGVSRHESIRQSIGSDYSEGLFWTNLPLGAANRSWL